MFTTVSVSVQEFRGIRTASTNGTSSYRDFQRLPATKTNFKRQYLKGASNRVKSLKEESNFVQMCSERKENEKIFKFNRQDQLLNYRNLHLQKLQPINFHESNLESQMQDIQNKSQLTSPNSNYKSSSLQLVTDQKNQLIELIYNAQAIITKPKKTIYSYSHSHKTEEFLNSKATTQQNPSPKINNKLYNSKIKSIQELIITSSRTKNDIFLKSSQQTSQGSLKVTTQEAQNNQTPKLKFPRSLDGTKKFLKQFL